MDVGSSLWHEITPSSFAHERTALQHVRELLPDRHPYQAWSNFTFTSDQGHVREVDLLVAAPTGLFLVEIKNFRGRLGNTGSTWILTGERTRTFDSPLPLADQKAKELKGLLGRAASADRGIRMPFLRGCVFLAEPSMVCEIDPEKRHHLYGFGRNGLPDVGADLLLAPVVHAPPQPEFLRALPRLLQKVGIHRTRRSVAVGPWQIEPRPYDSGPTWQDHHADREDLAGEHRRIRIYLYERQPDPQARASVRHAAEREFRAARGIDHPGLLVPLDLLDHEMGPALVIDQSRDAVRLDHWMALDGAALDLPARLGLVRQLAEAVRYAHDRRLVHRALSPRAVVVEPGPDGPRLRVGEWQTAARGLSSATTTHRVVPTTHAGQHVEMAAAPYLAPEFTGEVDGTVAIDVFGLGATAYLLVTGRPPAEGRGGLMERLAAEGGLHPSVVDDSVPADLDALVALATAPKVTDRLPDVEEFLAELDRVISGTTPEEQPADPWTAQAGAELPEGYVVTRVLGTGATARAFLVQRDGLETVLKVGRSAEAAGRLEDEAVVLEDLRHEHLVLLKRGAFALGPLRFAIEIDYAGEQTLGQLLRDDGALLPDQLQRFGDQLLDAVDHLERRDVVHRDVKPDNLGVRRHPKRGPALVLFDFSLAGASSADVLAGTRGYRDPFLGSDRRPVFDQAAERYAVAVTLHEMASTELPSWGEDGTDPRFVADDVSISSEIFAAALREPLTAFFRRALHRDADRRHPSAGAMRQAWNQVFAAMDADGPARTSHSSTDDPQELRDEAAEAALTDTALDAAGLSLRAVAVAQRMGASTVGELLAIPTRELWRARGLSRNTRLELVNRTSSWRKRLVGAAPVDPPRPAVGAAPPVGLDAVAARLLPAPTKRGADQVGLTRTLLGLPDAGGVLPDTRWPTLTEIATASGLTRARIGQITQARRVGWLADAAVDPIRADVAARLRDLGRVAAAGELAEQLLLSRGCDREDDPAHRRAFAYATLRAVVEADSIAETPLFATRRHRDRVLVALQVTDDEPLDTPSDAQLLDMAVELSDEALRLAAGDPLPTPVAVVRALEAVARRHDQGHAEQRLVQLAAAATGSVLANARMELFPHDLDPVRALRLSQAGAGIPPDGMPPEALRRRVAARFPGLAPLPDGLALARLLKDAGFDLTWNGDRLVPPGTSARSSSWRSSTSTGQDVVGVPVRGDGPEARLHAVSRDGGVRVVTVRRTRWAACREYVGAVAGAEPVDVSTAFVGALRDVALDRRITDFAVVLRADAPDAEPRARGNLDRVAGEAWARLAAQWAAADVLVLDALTPFGRYAGGAAVLSQLLDAARRGGRDGGPRTLVLVCPAQDEYQPPRIGAEAVGLESAEEWIVAPSAWTSEVA